jgi:hypothetical protein
MTALESKIHLQSRAKCCNDARAIAKFASICYDKSVPSGFVAAELRQKSDIVSMIASSAHGTRQRQGSWKATARQQADHGQKP